MKIYIVCFLALIIVSCNQTVSKDFIKRGTGKMGADYQLDSLLTLNLITKEDCRNYGIPEMNFSIVTPIEYEKKSVTKPKSILRFVKNLNNDKFEEIQVGTHRYDTKYSPKQEILDLEEFKNMPEIKDNPDLSIKLFKNLQIGSKNLNVYLQKLDNSSGKYLSSIPLNTIGVTIPSNDGWNALIVVFNKNTINSLNLFSEEEKAIINSIEIE